MQLKDTVDDMLSDDYRDRFKAEYDQVSIRRDKLGDILDAYYKGELNFQPKSSISNLESQLETMDDYLDILEERAKEEVVDL